MINNIIAFISTFSILYYYDLLDEVFSFYCMNMIFGLFIGVYSIRLLFRESLSIVDDLTTIIAYHKNYKTLAYLMATYTGYLLMHYSFNIIIYYMPFFYYPLKIINILVLLNFYVSYHMWSHHDFNSNLFLFNVGKAVISQYSKNRRFFEFLINDIIISNFKFFINTLNYIEKIKKN